MINTKIDRKHLYDKLGILSEIMEKLEPLFKRGMLVWTVDGYIQRPHKGLAWNVPWVYTVLHPLLRCDVDHAIIHQFFKFVPSKCRSCWKVVVRPRTVVELFDFYELQRALGLPGKCGAEPRYTVHGNYGGYFYCRSYEEGQNRYQLVRKLINEMISPEIPVILKRYCTEFELGEDSPPSDKLPDLTPRQKFIEEYLHSIIENTMIKTGQPDMLTAFTMRRWIKEAYKNGDTSYLELTDGKPLHKSVVTYHDKEKTQEK